MVTGRDQRPSRLDRGAADPEHGAVDDILRVHSLRPESLEGHLRLYRSVLHPRDPAGLDDGEILDANQVNAYFAYANRVADGLGIELEPWHRP